MTQITEKELIERILENMRIAKEASAKLQAIEPQDPMWKSLTQGISALHRTVNSEVSRKALTKQQTAAHIAARAVN